MKTWTTLAELKNVEACQPRYRRLCKALGGVRAYGKHTPIPLLKVLEVNGLDDVEWAIANVPSLKPVYDDYRAKRKPLDDDYLAKLKPIYGDYLANLNPLDDDYLAKLKTLDDDHQANLNPLVEDYLAKLKPIDDDYRAKRNAIDDDYLAKRKAVLVSVISKEDK